MKKMQKGIRKNINGTFEGYGTLHRKDGTSFAYSFTRDTIDEVEFIKAMLRVKEKQEGFESNVQKIKIERNTNKIIEIIKAQGKGNNKTELSNGMLVKDYLLYFLFVHRKNGVNGRKVEDTTFNTYIDKAKYIKKYLGDKKVEDLTLIDLQEFIDKLQEKGQAITTTRQTRDLLTSMMHFAKKDGIIKENVLAEEKLTLKENKKTEEKKTIQEKDYKKYIDYCKEHKYVDLIFLICTGCRASELAGITWKDIDIVERYSKY